MYYTGQAVGSLNPGHCPAIARSLSGFCLAAGLLLSICPIITPDNRPLSDRSVCHPESPDTVVRRLSVQFDSDN
jgi:hypothetical protein